MTMMLYPPFYLLLLTCYAMLLSAASAKETGKIGPGVWETMESEGSVRVMIALDTTSSSSGLLSSSPQQRGGDDLHGLATSIAGTQDAVLARVSEDSDDAAGFLPQRVFHYLPALAGTVLTPQTLHMLNDDPLVVKIDLDEVVTVANDDDVDAGTGGRALLADSVPLIGADQRIASGNDGSGVTVAVIDTGIDTNHPSLEDSLVAEACILENLGGQCPDGSSRQTGPGSAEDGHGHGTHVTGIITSPLGVAPGAGIVSIKTLNNQGSGVISDTTAALDSIIASNPHNIQVINMSLGSGSLFNGECDSAASWTITMGNAIDTLRSMGIIAFAAAGNNGSTTSMAAPACLRNVISVGNSNDSDMPVPSTNSNAFTDIFAPGAAIVSTSIGGGFTTLTGTSLSSPHAAGCAALLIQSGDATTMDEIETRLETSTFLVNRGGLNFPRIDCSPDVPNAVCGNGEVELGEECDDGNAIDTDDCTSSCNNAVCGDGIVWDGVEECDDGNDIDTDACTNGCKKALPPPTLPPVPLPVPTPAPIPTPTGVSVTALVLIDASSNNKIMDLSDGVEIAMNSLASTNLNIQAIVSFSGTGSVKFGYNGNANYRTEKVAPYAMCGDASGNYKTCTELVVGDHVVTATPFVAGMMGTPQTVSFRIVQDGSPPMPPTVPPPVPVPAPQPVPAPVPVPTPTPAPIGNSIPWIEDFNLPDGTQSDSGSTAWTATRNQGKFEVKGGALFVNGKGTVGKLETGIIDISGSISFGISLDVYTVATGDGMEKQQDYVQLYAAVDGGAEVLIGEVKGELAAPTSIACSGCVSGNQLKLVIYAYVSFGDEWYYMDNLSVVPAAGRKLRSALF